MRCEEVTVLKTFSEPLVQCPRDVLWTDRTSPEVADSPPRVSIFPIGAIEQHGPHLPLSTDIVIPQRLALAVAERVEAAVLPTLPFGARSHANSGGGERFAGGLAIEPETLMGAVESVVADAARWGAELVLVLSWHFENAAFVWEGCRRGADAVEGAEVLLVDSPGDLLPESLLTGEYPGDFPGWAAEHAAIVETSLMLHLEPELVRTDLIPPSEPIQPVVDPWHSFPDDRARVPDSGVYAAVRQASPDFGLQVFDALCDGMIRVIDGWRESASRRSTRASAAGPAGHEPRA